jgi:hypothetical protein
MSDMIEYGSMLKPYVPTKALIRFAPYGDPDKTAFSAQYDIFVT